jgi:hypothetical protein
LIKSLSIFKNEKMKKVLLITLVAFWGMALFAQTDVPVSYKELPKKIQKYVTKNYDGWKMDKAMEGQNSKGKMTYCDVYVSKGTDKLKLTFDKNEEFVKKETLAAPAPAAAPVPAAAPAAAAPTPAPVATPVAVPDAAPAPSAAPVPATAPVPAPK